MQTLVNGLPPTFTDLVTDVNTLKNTLNDIMPAILSCFERVAWTTTDGHEYFETLAAAINPPSELVSISATYTQPEPIYVTDSLDTLRAGLLVTATYANTTTAAINGYALFGTLTEGTSIITVSYGGKTTTFTVNVSDTALLYKLPGITTFDGSASGVIDSGVALLPYDRDVTVVINFTPTNENTRQHVFYAGDVDSPYYNFMLECAKDTYVWRATSYGSYINLSNVTTNNPVRIVLRHESASQKFNIVCASNNSLVRGETGMSRFISSRNTLVGGLRTDVTPYGFVGTISEFKMFTRYYSDAEAMAYVTGV